MFKRIELESWLQVMPQIGLWIFIGVFLLVVIRILRKPRSEVRHLAELPLDPEKPHHEK